MRGTAFLSALPLRPDAPAIRRRLVNAVYADGVLRPVEPLALEDGSAILITVLPAEQARLGVEPSTAAPVEPRESQFPQPKQPGTDGADRSFDAPPRSESAFTSSERLAWILFGLGMLVYLFTRFWKITQFPIYFFADEASNSLIAQDLIRHGFKNAQGVLFPLYFEVAGNRWGPLFSTYIHGLSMTLFGKSVLITRGTQAVVSLLAPLATSMILKQVFKVRYWWIGVLLLAVAPAWFLHSRTGFETVMMSSFFACFLWCYLLYRTRSPRYLFAALLFGALTFYTYASGQMIMVSVGAVLVVSDIRYHLRHWRTTALGLGLVGLLALPALRFRAVNPQFMTITLRTMDSYWFHDLTLAQKAEQFIRTWAQAVSPVYWFVPSQTLLVRHRMEGYGNLSFWLLPFFLIGVVWCLWKIKSPAPRAVVLTALVTPMGSALLADVGITRVLAFTIPASLLVALGFGVLFDFLDRSLHMRYEVATGVLFVGLSVASFGMLRDALEHGPLWFRDYGLYGMQYGARQIFEEAIPEYLRDHPGSQVVVSPTWANGTENFVAFFLSQEQQARVQLSNADYFMVARRPLTKDMLFVMTPEEYGRALSSGKFKSIDVLRTLPYPDGRPGFYFAHLIYADNLDALLAQEREARSRLVPAEVTIDGQAVQLLHSQLDMGEPPNLFDGDLFTLVRGLEANPLVFDFTFPQPRPIKGLLATFAAMDFKLKVSLYGEGAAAPVEFEQTFRNQPATPSVTMALEGGPQSVARLRLEVLQLDAGVDVHIHVRELKLL